ncbi:hypothetical protein [Pseudomonas sp. SCB32]|uniref:hypothetical protein n=1 Tax=Pseudomonas sp. SCB32 TaxID=2653853 RepID=UPI001264AB7B|nr:hypothetical protein [Pseudomonas sp. SCB32]
MRLQVMQVMVVLCTVAGCPDQVKPEPRTVRVEVPVAIPCRAPEVPEPSWATAVLQKGDSLQTKVRALLAELEQRRGYERLLTATINACR